MLLSALLLNACGVVSPCRYGNGLKLNLSGLHRTDGNLVSPEKTRLKTDNGIKQKNASPLFAGKYTNGFQDTFQASIALQTQVPDQSICTRQTSLKYGKAITNRVTGKTLKILQQRKKFVNYSNNRTPEFKIKPSDWDPNIVIGVFVFYGSIAIGILSQLQILFPPFFIVIAFMGLLIGLVFTLIGYFSIDPVNDIIEKWLAYSVFGVLIAGFLLGLLGLMIYLTLFSD